MIVNVFSVLAGGVGALRFATASLLIVISVRLWQAWRRQPDPESRAGLEERFYLAGLVALFLAVLNMAAWPLLYLVLQSYVPEWPGIMCVYGVTRIGAESDGISRFLPLLLGVLQVLRPGVIFLTGAWLTLYSIYRRAETARLMLPMLALLLASAVASSVDASVEGAYLTLPKRDEYLTSGCCTVPRTNTADTPSREGSPFPLLAGFVLSNVGMVGSLGAFRRLGARGKPGSALALLPPALLTAILSSAFLVRVLTPRVLRHPAHYCVYDLIPHAPLVLLGIVSFGWATFCVGWTVAAQWGGRWSQETSPAREVGLRLLGSSQGGYVGALLAAVAAWVVAGWRG